MPGRCRSCCRRYWSRPSTSLCAFFSSPGRSILQFETTVSGTTTNDLLRNRHVATQVCELRDNDKVGTFNIINRLRQRTAQHRICYTRRDAAAPEETPLHQASRSIRTAGSTVSLQDFKMTGGTFHEA